MYVNTIHGADIALDVQYLSASSLTLSSSTDFALVCKASASVTLPAASAGKKVYIKLSGYNTMATISAAAGDQIYEVAQIGASLMLEASGSAVTLIADNAENWSIV